MNEHCLPYQTQRSEEEQRYIRARTRQEALLRAASDYYMSWYAYI